MSIRSLAALLLYLLLGGCASLVATEQEQFAYRGEGSNPCLFGGVTAEADRHCQEVSQGLYGALLNINARIVHELAGGADATSCQAHVARVREALWPRADLEVRSVFSCPQGLEECHVSALIMARSGEVYVLDNGSVLNPRLYSGSVSRFGEYHAAVRGEYWFHPPIAATAPRRAGRELAAVSVGLAPANLMRRR